MDDNQSLEQLNQLLEEAKTSLSQIRSNKTQISNRLQEIETFYTQFEGLKDQINDGDEGINAVFERAKALRQEIEQLKDGSQTKLTEIESQFTSVSSKVQEIETFYTQFEELRIKIEDDEEGLEAILGQATDFKNKISQKNKSAGDTFLAMKELKTKSEELKKTSEKDKSTIETYKTESEDFKKSIGEILDLVTPSSLTNEFKNRETEIKDSVKFWRRALFGSILLLAGSVFYIYYLQSTSTNGFADWSQWYRYLFTSPLIYLVYLCSKNYTFERDLLEKYAFKAVLSTSLSAYIKLLNDYFPNNKTDILNFTLNSTSKIYKEPFQEKDKKRKFMFGIKSIFNVGIEDEEIKNNIDINPLMEREKAGIKEEKTETKSTQVVTKK